MLTALIAAQLVPAALASHRDAPGIAADPAADITDFYMFRSPEDPSKLVLVMNVWPYEAPGAGPSYYKFDDSVLYAFRIDNEGDGVEDVVFQVEFDSWIREPESFLYNLGPVATRDDVNVVQTYKVEMVVDDVETDIIPMGSVAPVNVGTQSIVAGGYNPAGVTPGTLTTEAIVTSGQFRAFAGPRQDGFFADLERTFDLMNLNGLDVGPNANSLLGYNVHTIAIEVPITAVTRDGGAPGPDNGVIAAWATTSRRAVLVRRSTGVEDAERGPWVQVSRQGNPLVNAVLIPLAHKDTFNMSEPEDDGQFLPYAQALLFAAYMDDHMGTSCPTTADMGLGLGGREDVVQVLMTGSPTFGTQPAEFALGGAIPDETDKVFAPFEALRIDLTGSATPGWPNGRRPGDDVMDGFLSMMCGALGTPTPVTDGVDATGLSFLSSFPFLGDPWAGDDHPKGGHDL